MYKAQVLRFGKNLKSNQTLIWSYCNFEADYTTRLIGRVASARSEYSIFVFAVVCGFSAGKQSENKKFRFRFFSNPQKAFIFDWWHWHCFLTFLRNSSSLEYSLGSYGGFLRAISGHKSNKELINNNDSEAYRAERLPMAKTRQRGEDKIYKNKHQLNS